MEHQAIISVMWHICKILIAYGDADYAGDLMIDDQKEGVLFSCIKELSSGSAEDRCALSGQQLNLSESHLA
jgi:hypothetical protein